MVKVRVNCEQQRHNTFSDNQPILDWLRDASARLRPLDVAALVKTFLHKAADISGALGLCQ